MSSQHHIIYVPGIQDNIFHIQSSLISLWRLWGIYGHCHAMPWAGEEAYQTKIKRLVDQIDDLSGQGHRLSLVGASAGASAVLNAYTKRSTKISGLVIICAKINAPETVSAATYRANPAFKTSLELLQINLSKLKKADKAKMLSVYSPTDQYVPYAATTIPGVAEAKLPGLRHGYAILYALSFGVPTIFRFLKSL